jgi:hypothetical protein
MVLGIGKAFGLIVVLRMGMGVWERGMEWDGMARWRPLRIGHVICYDIHGWETKKSEVYNDNNHSILFSTPWSAFCL